MRSLTLICISLMLVIPSQARTITVDDPEYQVMFLYPSGGYHMSEARGVCGGQQVGRGDYHALLWSSTPQSAVDLHPSGYGYSMAYGTSGFQQAGSGDGHALLWSGTAESVIDLHPNVFEYSVAYDIWGDQQVGEGRDSQGYPHALLWYGTADSVVDLHPSGYTQSRAWGTSGSQQVGSGDRHALLWYGTADSVIELHPGGYKRTRAYATSGSQQVGVGDGHALLWSGTAESVVDLHPRGFDYSGAYGVSNGKQVGYGTIEAAHATHALLWWGTAESVVDLHAYLPPEYDTSVALDIDSAGDIVGYVRLRGVGADYKQAVLWTLVPKHIGVRPSKFDVHYYVGDANPEPESLFIRARGIDVLNWLVIEDCNWLEVWPLSGQSRGENDQVSLSIDVSGLESGLYQCTVSIFDAGFPDDIRYVPVNLYIGSRLFVPGEHATIQSAIDAARDYDMVLVADGIYTGEGNRDIDFLGKPVTVRSENGPENCVIDCEGLGRAFYFGSGENTQSVLEGFSLTNGSASFGGAIYCDEGGSPTIINCNIGDNSAKLGGGGVSCREYSNPTIINCNISDNSAIGGGGIYCSASNPIVENCIMKYNSAPDGGAVYCFGKSIPLIRECIISFNSANDGKFGGGAVFSHRSSPTIKKCKITGNSSNRGGGGIYYSSPSGDNILTITNCAITGNSAKQGGAVWYYAHRDTDDSLIIRNCTIVGNMTEEQGSLGGAIFGEYSGDDRISNCIIRDNWPMQIYPSTSDLSVAYSNVEVDFWDYYEQDDDVWPGEGNIDAEPRFVEAGYWEANSVWVEGDYRLLPSSPCIDAGDPNYVAGPNETDLDGNPRIVNDRIDMGAYEYIPPVPAEININPKTLNLKSKGNFITCRIQLPEGYNVADIDPNSIFLEDEIPSDRVVLEGGALMVKFSRSAVQELLADLDTPAEAELLVTGRLSDGILFEGTDTITVINKGRKE